MSRSCLRGVSTLSYVLNFLIIAGIYSILSLSLNLLIGYVGVFSLSHAALFGIGAYISALAMKELHLPWLLGMLGAALVTGIAGSLVAGPALRIAGDYYIVASYALQVIAYTAFVNLTNITQGPAGLAGIPRPQILDFRVAGPVPYLVLTTACVLVALGVAWRLAHSPFGRVLRAISEDEIAVTALGKDVLGAKVKVAMVSAALAGMAGSLYAHYVTFINPSSFTVDESVFIAAMVIVGGAGSIWGSILGALTLTVLPEAIKVLPVPLSMVGPLRQLLYGVLLVAFMFLRPQGLLGRSFSRATLRRPTPQVARVPEVEV